MPKIPQCDRCLYNARSFYIVCAVHAAGIEGDRCPDFRPDPNWEGKQTKNLFVLSCLPMTYYDELLGSPSQDCCPACGAEFQRDYRAVVHLDCPCGWRDGSN
jgi:hypothetical protein